MVQRRERQKPLSSNPAQAEPPRGRTTERPYDRGPERPAGAGPERTAGGRIAERRDSMGSGLGSLGRPNSIVRQFNFWDDRYEGRRLFAELLGTFFLVLVAAGAGMVNARFGAEEAAGPRHG